MPKAEGPAKVKLRSPGPVSPLRLATGSGAQWQDRRRPEHHSASASTPTAASSHEESCGPHQLTND